MTTHKVFVYGTLKRGHGNHDWHLHSAEYLGKATTVSRQMAMICLGGFPGVYREPKAGTIKGELYSVDDETLARLDRLEGNGSFYQRELVQVRTADGRRHTAWIYLLLDPEQYRGTQVASGEWRPHRDEPVAYVFGYGSLMHEGARLATTGYDVDQPIPVRLRGWDRGWHHAGCGWTPMGIRRARNSKATGVLIPVTREQLKALDAREVTYRQCEVQHAHIDRQYSQAAINPRLPILLYESMRSKPKACRRSPILLTYCDVVMAGSKAYGWAFWCDTMATVTGTDGHVEDDRSRPRYARACEEASYSEVRAQRLGS